MTEAPKTHYARSGDVNIAYKVVGEGPRDLLFISGWFSHLDFMWELPQPREFFSRLASFSRLVMFDKRGTGLSDPVDRAASFNDRVDDVLAVMDATGMERADVCALSEGGALGAILAATHPERVSRLVLLNAAYEAQQRFADWRPEIEAGWGEGALFEQFLPEVQDVPGARELWARTQRMSASRGMALLYFDLMFEVDAAPALPAITAPTLVLHGVEDRIIPAEHIRELASRIPGAEYRELPGGHIPWVTGGEAFTDAIQEFFTGAPVYRPPTRRLATVLFTDIVDSTARATQLGDREWREVLDRHDETVRGELGRFAGREVKTTGDGFFAAFESPADAIDCAQAVCRRAEDIGVAVRAGIHTGQCEVRGDDLGGIAVHIGARVAALAGPGEVLVSRTVRDLVAGGEVAFESRGEHELKGIPDRWQVFAVGPAG